MTGLTAALFCVLLFSAFAQFILEIDVEWYNSLSKPSFMLSPFGFRVTVGTGRGNVGFHKTRQGVLKPVLMWAEDGTEYRRTRGSAKRPSRVTGKMKRYGFLERAKNQTAGRITNDIRDAVVNGIIKTSQKYGCQ